MNTHRPIQNLEKRPPCANHIEEVVFTEETYKVLQELGDLLRVVHRRMTEEGYHIVDGVVKKYEESCTKK